jgi:hypothetical protein
LGNAVTIVGPTGSIRQVIGGGDASASLALSGYVDPSGTSSTGMLAEGAVSVTCTVVVGGLIPAVGSRPSASMVTVADGAPAMNGGDAGLETNGAVPVGTADGVYRRNPVATVYVHDPAVESRLSILGRATAIARNDVFVGNRTLVIRKIGSGLRVDGNPVRSRSNRRAVRPIYLAVGRNVSRSDTGPAFAAAAAPINAIVAY